MQKIPLIQAKAGMILAHDVFRDASSAGMPVCGKDTELTDVLISRLEQMNIQVIDVLGHPLWEKGERSIDELLHDLDNRFSRTLNNPLNVMLHDIYKLHIIKSMGGVCDRQAQ